MFCHAEDRRGTEDDDTYLRPSAYILFLLLDAYRCWIICLVLFTLYTVHMMQYEAVSLTIGARISDHLTADAELE